MVWRTLEAHFGAFWLCSTSLHFPKQLNFTEKAPQAGEHLQLHTKGPSRVVSVISNLLKPGTQTYISDSITSGELIGVNENMWQVCQEEV